MNEYIKYLYMQFLLAVDLASLCKVFQNLTPLVLVPLGLSRFKEKKKARSPRIPSTAKVVALQIVQSKDILDSTPVVQAFPKS